MSEAILVSSLPIAAPPMLEQALGYTNDARQVAFWIADDAYYSDGQITATCEWDAAYLFFYHPFVGHYLRPYCIGSSEEQPASFLLLDRETRTLFITPVAEARRLLCEQWGMSDQPDPMLVVTEQEWEQLVQDLMVQMQPTSSQLAALWREHQDLVEQLSAWLTSQWEVQG
jgi:hypothetical protein